MKLSHFFNLYLIKLFIIELFLITITYSILSINANHNKFKNLKTLDRNMIGNVALMHKSNNEMARDLILYRHVEENGLDTAMFSTSAPDPNICTSRDRVYFCEERNDKYNIYQEVLLADELLGYVKLTGRVKKNGYANLIYLVLIVLVLNLVLTILGTNFFLKEPLRKNLKNLLNNLVKEEDEHLTSQEIEEYVSIQQEFRELIRSKQKLEEEKYDLKLNIQKLEITRQVAHDIKSPLAALEVVMDDMKELPSDIYQITKLAINRINEIANDLSSNYRSIEKASTFIVSILVSNIVQEKSLSFNNIHIEFDFDEHLFIHINASEFQRAISNILNNSIDSVQEDGKIEIFIKKVDESVSITIQDSGPGFPNDILCNEIKKGNTIGKEGGQGLGLHYAKTILEKYDGSIKLQNHGGAMVEILLPSLPSPEWLQTSVNLENQKHIIFVDDDDSIIELWKKKINKVEFKSSFFSSIEIFVDFVEKEKSMKNNLLIIDFDLNAELTGVDIITKYKIENVIICTSHFDNELIQNFCLSHNVKLIPKQIIKKIHFKV